MSFAVTSIDDLDTELVRQLHAEFTQLMQEKYPELELTRGVIHDLLSYFSGGVSGGVNQTEINRVLEANSLLAIAENSALAADEVADKVFTNYRVSRTQGLQAIGEMTIVVESSVSVVIPVGAIYDANGVAFSVVSAFTALPPGSLPTKDTDRVMENLGDGTFAFTIDMQATAVGTPGNITKNTKMAPQAPPANYVTAYAATDFTGGRTTETNAEVLVRLISGIAAKAWSNRVNIEALIKEQPAFANTLHYSIIGYGNAEMMRDQHWIFPVSGGGRVDIYARTTALPQTVELQKECVLVEKQIGASIWQFSLNRDDAPGFYEVSSIRLPTDPADAAGFNVTFDQRGFDMSGGGFLPDLLTAEEAVYTRYQTTVIRFEDTETNVADIDVGDTGDYIVSVKMMPMIDELQTFCGGHEVRNLAGDVAIKAAVPGFLIVNFDIEQGVSETAPDIDAIKQELATTINNLDFPGQLHASLIADVAHNYLTRRQALGPIDMHVRIRKPDGEIVYVRNSQILELPDQPLTLTTGRTTALMLDPDDIGISVVNKGFGDNL